MQTAPNRQRGVNAPVDLPVLNKPAPKIRWPRTFKGWMTLFWLALGRCPIHKRPLHVDDLTYDDGRRAYCLHCDGIGIWPQGAREALRQNAIAHAATTES